jgi:hypothetical protein
VGRCAVDASGSEKVPVANTVMKLVVPQKAENLLTR